MGFETDGVRGDAEEAAHIVFGDEAEQGLDVRQILGVRLLWLVANVGELVISGER